MQIKNNTSLYDVLREINFGNVDVKNSTFPDAYQYDDIAACTLLEILRESADDDLLSCPVTNVVIIGRKPNITFSIQINRYDNVTKYKEERTEIKMTLIDLLTSSTKDCHFSTCDATCLPDELKNPFYSRNDLLGDLYINPDYKKYLDYEVFDIRTALAVSKEMYNNPVICFNLKMTLNQL